MVLVTGNWRMWLAGMVASLAIFGVLFFTVIKPSSDTANQAIKSGLQQSQQAINQAQKDLSGASSQGSQVSKASSQAQKQLNSAAKLATCVSQAGTDPSKLSACQVKFGH